MPWARKQGATEQVKTVCRIKERDGQLVEMTLTVVNDSMVVCAPPHPRAGGRVGGRPVGEITAVPDGAEVGLQVTELGLQTGRQALDVIDLLGEEVDGLGMAVEGQPGSRAVGRGARAAYGTGRAGRGEGEGTGKQCELLFTPIAVHKDASVQRALPKVHRMQNEKPGRHNPA
jgi:hypothetical protein